MAEFTGSGINLFYVNGQNGDDDANNGESPGAAWKTLQKAIDMVASGSNPQSYDEIRIMKTSDDSTYYGGATGSINLSFYNKYVHFTGVNNKGGVDGTVVEMNGGLLDSSTPMLYISVSTADYVLFSNLKFDAGGTAQHCVEIEWSGSGSAIDMDWTNCRFTDATSHGVYTNNKASYWNFINCRFDNNGEDGLNMTSSNFAMSYKCLFDNNGDNGGHFGGFNRISECVFYNNGSDGAQINGNGAVVSNCVFDSNSGGGAYFTGTRQGICVNSMFSNNTGAGITPSSGAAMRIHNPAFYNNGNGNYWSPTSDHLSMYNYVSGATTEWGGTADFDFTPDSASPLLGAGIVSPYRWFGSTADDIGINKFRAEGGESISIF